MVDFTGLRQNLSTYYKSSDKTQKANALRDAQHEAEKALEDMDTNKDGRVSREELAKDLSKADNFKGTNYKATLAMAQIAASKIDKENDGVTSVELMSYMLYEDSTQQQSGDKAKNSSTANIDGKVDDFGKYVALRNLNYTKEAGTTDTANKNLADIESTMEAFSNQVSDINKYSFSTADLKTAFKSQFLKDGSAGTKNDGDSYNADKTFSDSLVIPASVSPAKGQTEADYRANYAADKFISALQANNPGLTQFEKGKEYTVQTGNAGSKYVGSFDGTKFSFKEVDGTVKQALADVGIKLNTTDSSILNKISVATTNGNTTISGISGNPSTLLILDLGSAKGTVSIKDSKDFSVAGTASNKVSVDLGTGGCSNISFGNKMSVTVTNGDKLSSTVKANDPNTYFTVGKAETGKNAFYDFRNCDFTVNNTKAGLGYIDAVGFQGSKVTTAANSRSTGVGAQLCKDTQFATSGVVNTNSNVNTGCTQVFNKKPVTLGDSSIATTLHNEQVLMNAKGLNSSAWTKDCVSGQYKNSAVGTYDPETSSVQSASGGTVKLRADAKYYTAAYNYNILLSDMLNPLSSGKDIRKVAIDQNPDYKLILEDTNKDVQTALKNMGDQVDVILSNFDKQYLISMTSGSGAIAQTQVSMTAGSGAIVQPQVSKDEAFKQLILQYQ